MGQVASEREAVIQEQVKFVEARHEDLRTAYLEQEHTRVELRRKVNQLTALHRAGLLFSSMMDREALIENVLQALIHDLQYERAMISFYDPRRAVVHDAHVKGVQKEIAAFARSREIPVSDPTTPEGTVLLKGEPLLVTNIDDVWPRLHPLNQRLARLTGTQSLIAVPLKAKDRILGSLTVDRTQPNSLTADDLDLMVTVGNQVAIAIDNAAAYEQIEELNAGLEAKVKERTTVLEQFLAKVSHDLRTPLAGMTGFAENMLAGLTGPLTEKQQQYLTRMISNAGRLRRLVDDLLDMLVDPDHRELALSEVSLSHLSMEVIEQLRPLAGAKQQQLDLNIVTPNMTVWADSDKLHRILSNLVDNAIKYTDSMGSIQVCLEARSSLCAKVSVRDTGEGIPAEALSTIFDSAVRIARHKSPVSSHGLGLSIVRDLVELHGGTVDATSELGKGSIFSFTIPLRRPLERRETAFDHRKKRLLIADDNRDIRQLLYDRLSSEGYEVETAADGEEAFHALQNQSFDGLILDIGMPKMSGLDVLHRIRQEQPSLPIIMITAAEARDSALTAIQAGAQAYLLKPFEAAELLRVVEEWLGRAVSENPSGMDNQGGTRAAHRGSGS
jgi:signal transduction histidine kinase/ActR/RegA family two-component response regulator